jgi:general nucleoside transport system permease protein
MTELPPDSEIKEAFEVQEQFQESPPPVGAGDYAPSVAERLALFQRAGGVVVPVITTVIAFLIGGIVIAASAPGHKAFWLKDWDAAKGIFLGTGLNWIWHFPWWHHLRDNAAYNLQLTLLGTTSLILTGLAVAFAFRCGLFNIGGNGQYILGAVTAVWIGGAFVHMDPVLHVLLTIALAAGAGAIWAAVAGFLKATRGVHEVISTIMLNWIAVSIAEWAFSQAGPLQNSQEITNPVSGDIAQGAHLYVFWGSPVLSGLDIGFFIALVMPVVYWAFLNRTTVGYEVRAVGFNPEAARYGGISIKRSYMTAMAFSGALAGLAAAIDILGYLFRLGQLDIRGINAGFIGIAVALLGRNSAVGIPFAALLFAGLVQGTSTRNPAIQSSLPPTLAGNLTYLIMGLVLLFIGADLLILYVWQARKKLRLRPKPKPAAIAEGPA